MTDKLHDPRFVCLQDFEKEALNILPKEAVDYYTSGAGDEDTLRENREAFKR